MCPLFSALLEISVADSHGVCDMRKTQHGRIFGGRYPDFARLSKTFDNAGIEARYSVCPPDWFLSERRWPERNQAYLSGAVSLYRQAAQRALKATSTCCAGRSAIGSLE